MKKKFVPKMYSILVHLSCVWVMINSTIINTVTALPAAHTVIHEISQLQFDPWFRHSFSSLKSTLVYMYRHICGSLELPTSLIHGLGIVSVH